MSITATQPLPAPAATSGARPNPLGMPRAELERFFETMGEKPFRARQMLKWVHQQGVLDYGAMSNLSRALREYLAVHTELRLPEVVGERASSDGTCKWLLRLAGGNSVETVFIPEEHRGTLCVSSQVGCALNCSFCATARQGFNRNLQAAEIVGQLWLAKRLLAARGAGEHAVTNVVLMGMGEPLLNFDAACSAMDIMLDDLAYGLGRRRVTLSTAGLVPGIRRLAERCPVALAVSLHAPNDRLRDTLVPLNRSYPIAALLDACRAYAASDPKHVITFEYVMLDGVNDTPAHARELTSLLRGLPAKVNLIPFNPFTAARFRRSPPAVIDAFREVLLRGGITTITRRTRGEDIDAACGQLAGEVRARGRISARRVGGALHRRADGSHTKTLYLDDSVR